MSSSLYQDQKNDVMPPDVEDKNATDVTTSDAPDISLASDPNRGLRMRHVQLIAISGSIGSALFVSIGGPLTGAGPLGLLIGMGFWSTVVFAAANCLIETTCLLPVEGGFITLAERFVSRPFGMALGWNYVITQWALVSYEMNAINVIVSYWKADLNQAICIMVGLFLLAVVNLYSVRWYGEVEFWISITKLFLVAGLTLYTFITMLGGNPIHDRYGFRFWKTPGPFVPGTTAKQRVAAIFDAVCWSTFAIVGPDYISMVSGAVKSPRRVLPKSFNATVFRIIGFYMTGALCVGIVASSDDENLLGAIAAGAPGAAKSPYVISMNRLHIPVLPSLVNALVLISLFSTANSFVFVGSRALYGLSLKGMAPKLFAKSNRHGVPYYAVGVTLAFGLLSLLSVSAGAVKVLNWWINLTGAAQLITWTCIGITYLRFRSGLKSQGLLNTDFLPKKGWLQPFSGYYLTICSPVVFFFSGYYLFYPGAFDGPTFVFTYGSAFIFLAIYSGSTIWSVVRTKSASFFVPAGELDFQSGLQEIEDLTRASDEKRAMKQGHRSLGQKISDLFF